MKLFMDSEWSDNIDILWLAGYKWYANHFIIPAYHFNPDDNIANKCPLKSEELYVNKLDGRIQRFRKGFDSER